jgi:hypothetical protein
VAVEEKLERDDLPAVLDGVLRRSGSRRAAGTPPATVGALGWLRGRLGERTIPTVPLCAGSPHVLDGVDGSRV